MSFQKLAFIANAEIAIAEWGSQKDRALFMDRTALRKAEPKILTGLAYTMPVFHSPYGCCSEMKSRKPESSPNSMPDVFHANLVECCFGKAYEELESRIIPAKLNWLVPEDIKTLVELSAHMSLQLYPISRLENLPHISRGYNEAAQNHTDISRYMITNHLGHNFNETVHLPNGYVQDSKSRYSYSLISLKSDRMASTENFSNHIDERMVKHFYLDDEKSGIIVSVRPAKIAGHCFE